MEAERSILVDFEFQPQVNLDMIEYLTEGKKMNPFSEELWKKFRETLYVK